MIFRRVIRCNKIQLPRKAFFNHMASRTPLVTTITDTYYRPALLKEAVEALRRQTYDKLEIILVNNGATPETIEYLYEVEAQDKRVKLIHFKENQYSQDDPVMMLDTCLNAGLKVATGDYIWYQADDDLIADDYIEKMVALFDGDPECVTAAGVPISIDINGKVLSSPPLTGQPRYMPGHLLALDYIRVGGMFRAPGTIFTIKREALIKAGGFHRAIEFSHLFGIVPFGTTGFDQTAHFFWRRHEGQLNLKISAAGQIGIRELMSLLKDWDIKGQWKVFGEDIAEEVVSTIIKRRFLGAADFFATNLYQLRWHGCARLLQDSWNQTYFWKSLPISFWNEKQVFKRQLKKMVKGLTYQVQGGS